MIFLVTALRSEARPFIDALRMRKRVDVPAFEIFTTDDFALILSGIGKIKSATATTFLLSRSDAFPPAAILNIGVAAASREKGAIGDAFQINKITDESTNRCFFPDLLVGGEFLESDLITVDRPVCNDMHGTLADMEASGFFQAASVFVPLHRIQIVKILSDFTDPTALSADLISRLVESKRDAVLSFAGRVASQPPETISPLSPEEASLIERLCERFHLTAAQSHHLRETAVACKIRSGKDLTCLAEFLPMATHRKEQNKTILSRMIQVLTADALFPSLH